MRFTDLSQHLHRLRYGRTQRALGYRMTAMEIWECAVQCDLNGIAEIRLQEVSLPAPFEGIFSRLRSRDGTRDIGLVTVNSDLEKHWKEFAVAKELMHCWSPPNTHVKDVEAAKQLVIELTGKSSKFTAPTVADISAIAAAAEVMLPHQKLEKHFSQGHDYNEIASQNGLHPEIAHLLCLVIPLTYRKSGSL